MRILALLSLLCCFVLPRESRADAGANGWAEPAAAAAAGPCIGGQQPSANQRG